MHSFTDDKYTVHFNGDYSGVVKISINGTDTEIEISFAFLKTFVADYVRLELISKLENATDDEILLRR